MELKICFNKSHFLQIEVTFSALSAATFSRLKDDIVMKVDLQTTFYQTFLSLQLHLCKKESNLDIAAKICVEFVI